ncbi:MAG: histidine kinase dimerization/phospho-acceptor domain-containing protein, partial [Chloroflexota bacterium]
MSIRLRLALWYSGILTAVITIFGLVVWLVLAIILTTQTDQRLRQTANQVILASAIDADLSRLKLPPLEIFQADGLYIQIIEVTGQVQRVSQNLGSFNKPLDAENIGQEIVVIHDVTVGGARVRVLTQRIVTANGTVLGYVQVGALMRDVDQAQSLLVLILVAGGALSVGLSTVFVMLTTGRALRPLDAVTNAALQITRADDLSRRIPLTGPATDEVGRLVIAFNDTLERLERLFNSQKRFLTDISHDLRTPLTAIRGNVDLLRRMKDAAADRQSLDAIQSETERMSRLVGDLLMLAQA